LPVVGAKFGNLNGLIIGVSPTPNPPFEAVDAADSAMIARDVGHGRPRDGGSLARCLVTLVPKALHGAAVAQHTDGFPTAGCLLNAPVLVGASWNFRSGARALLG